MVNHLENNLLPYHFYGSLFPVMQTLLHRQKNIVCFELLAGPYNFIIKAIKFFKYLFTLKVVVIMCESMFVLAITMHFFNICNKEVNSSSNLLSNAF